MTKLNFSVPLRMQRGGSGYSPYLGAPALQKKESRFLNSFFRSAYGSRTRDPLRERQVSWTTRRKRHLASELGCSAEAGGFEPPVRLPARQFSKLLVSATHPNFPACFGNRHCDSKATAKVGIAFRFCKVFVNYFKCFCIFFEL